jgi:adenylate cyclase class IV
MKNHSLVEITPKKKAIEVENATRDEIAIQINQHKARSALYSSLSFACNRAVLYCKVMITEMNPIIT